MNSQLITQFAELLKKQQDTITEQEKMIDLLLNILSNHLSEEEIKRLRDGRNNF